MSNITKHRKHPKAKPKLGDAKKNGGNDYVFVGIGHPLAPPNSGGWVRSNRLEAYNRTGGVARCDYQAAGTLDMAWRQVRVINGMILCQLHSRAMSFGNFLSDNSLLLPAMDQELTTLIEMPCMAETAQQRDGA